ncbi:FAD-binding oxidoreductase [Cellvibrio sp. pealriver]|uniref:FAD-binding oxidoreductase n=1 Tax=Cellvibrio sp. pealriver TaxID=1622269 RepID=UPI00066FE561|nr:FAD-binding oxidoreductase [Cellvibrio sp. pealriver]
MDRRQFLVVSLASAALTACGGGGGSDSSGGSSSSASDIWSDLDNQLAGTVLRPGNSQYDNFRPVFNTRFDSIKPAAVVRCSNAQDVQKALAFAQTNKLPLVPRCGGHGYAGYSTSEGGIVLELGQMNAISVGEGTAVVGAGAKLVDVYDQLTAKGVAIPAGSCLSVGIAGLTQGGGIGIVDRAYGLTCDNLLSADVILADGRMVTCDANNHADLFWALRGGGGGNFGVVTSFTFKTHTTSDITTLEAYFDFNDFVAVMTAWQAWPETLPNHIWAQVIPGWDSRSAAPSVYVRAFCIGSQAEMDIYWQQFLLAAKVTPLFKTQSTNSYRDTMLGGCAVNPSACYVAGYDPAGRAQRNAFAASSDFFHEPIDEAGLLVMKQAIADSFAQGNYGMMIMDLMRGAIDDIAADETAFIHRGALFSIEYYTYFAAGTSNATVDKAQTWVNNFRQIMKPWSSGGAYVNYIDPLISDWSQAYYGANYPRLQQVKATYDPTGFFRIPQGVKAS